MSGEATSRQDEHRFWILVAGVEVVVLLAALRSPLIAVALAAGVGVLALLSLLIGTDRKIGRAHV